VRQVDDIRRMVDEFSRFARMPKPVMEGEDVADTVRQAVFLMKVGHPDLDILAEIKQDPMRAQFDRRLISQALTNIIKNATEAIEQVPPDELGKGRIDVIAAQENDDIVIDVIDNGIGLPKVSRSRLLEPYVTTRKGHRARACDRRSRPRGPWRPYRTQGCIGLPARAARRLDAAALCRHRPGAESRRQGAGGGDAGCGDQRAGRRNKYAFFRNQVRRHPRPMMKQKSKPQPATDKTGVTHGQ
jgi:Signal transduction histidine kinase involved in nitrogen fixation and metabolism regulation